MNHNTRVISEVGQRFADEVRQHLENSESPAWWFNAPLPRRIHRCKGWTIAGNIERCACGAIRTNGRFWFEKNSRRKEKGERPGGND